MPMLTLRERNSGRLAAVNLSMLHYVTASAADTESPDESIAADTPVYLTAWNAAGHGIRYVPITSDGEEDREETDPDEAIRNFTAAAQRQEMRSSS